MRAVLHVAAPSLLSEYAPLMEAEKAPKRTTELKYFFGK